MTKATFLKKSFLKSFLMGVPWLIMFYIIYTHNPWSPASGFSFSKTGVTFVGYP